MIPIFIGGTGRSGTSILKDVLACHARIASIPGELRVIVDPGGALDLKSALTDRWSPYNADHAIHCFRQLMLACASYSLLRKAEVRLLRRVGISPSRYAVVELGQLVGMKYYRERLDRLISELSYHTTRGSWVGSPSYQIPVRIYEADHRGSDEVAKILRDFFEDLFRHRAGNGVQTHWIDSTPYNLLHVRNLLDVFPTLRFIHIYRDLRDVLASHRRFEWGGDDPVAIARRLSSILRRWFEVRESLPSSIYTEVALEDLVSSPVAHLTEICEFVGLELDEGVKESSARMRLDRAHAGRWKRDLSEDELTAVLPYLSAFLEAYGYEPQ